VVRPELDRALLFSTVVNDLILLGRELRQAPVKRPGNAMGAINRNERIYISKMVIVRQLKPEIRRHED